MELRRNHQLDLSASEPETAAIAGAPPNFDSMDFSDPATLNSILGRDDISTLTPAEVRKQARERASSIFRSYGFLQAVLVRHEATIHKRWAKKTKQQKLKLLLEAWPDMAANHRPDFRAFTRAEKQHTDSPRVKDCFMWPYINQEDIAKPKAFLLLLNARGRHPPSDFAASHFESMHLGLVNRKINPIFLNEHTMILHGATSARDYGQLLSWDDHEDAFDWLSTQKQFQPGEGLIVLEAQEKLMAFLVDCCKRILHDIPADTLLSDAFPHQPEPRLKTEAETSRFETLAVMAEEAPYRRPAQLDLHRVESVLAAMVTAAADHIWALREDPGYFAEHIFTAREHRLEMLKDTNGNIHPTLKPNRESLLWARVAGEVVVDAYVALESYADLETQARALRSLHIKYAGIISPTKDLPNEYLAAILKFRHYLNQNAKGPMNLLQRQVAASPPFRKFFTRMPPIDSNSSKLEVQSKAGTTMNKVEYHLVWLLRTLWEDGTNLFLAGLPLILDELERMIQSEPQANNLISGTIAGVIGELSITSQCLGQLDQYFPWARNFETDLLDRKAGIQKEFAEQKKPTASILAALQDRNLLQVGKLADPADKRFFYPTEKRRSKENTAVLRNAEQNLDEFWAAVDKVVHAHCGNLDGTAVREVLSQPRSLQRTPAWVDEPEVVSSKRKGRQTSEDDDVEALYTPLSTLYFGLPPSSSSTLSATTSKIKLKTRGESGVQEDTSSTAQDEYTGVNDSSSEPVTIPVDTRSLKVFRTLFFNPAVTSSPGEVPWSDFLHAMTSSGLFAAEKLYGSVWQFQKLYGSDQSRIQFHEPHPRGKIPFTVARRIGRRLHRSFGWAGHMFVLKEK